MPLGIPPRDRPAFIKFPQHTVRDAGPEQVVVVTEAAMAHTMQHLGKTVQAHRPSTRGRPVVPECGPCSTSRPSCPSRSHVAPQTVLTTSKAKLPATHLESSVKALEQLKASTINSEHLELRSSMALAIGCI